MTQPSWTLATAKSKLSELVEKAIEFGPQTVTRHGRAAVVVVSAEEWERKTRRSGSLADFFAQSPLHGSRLEITRRNDPPRRSDL
jgi:prevent-host-death family protein